MKHSLDTKECLQLLLLLLCAYGLQLEHIEKRNHAIEAHLDKAKNR